MRFTQLPLALAIAAQALPLAYAAEPFKPVGSGLSESVFSNNMLIISDGVRYANNTFNVVKQFFQLNLTASWTSDAPAWVPCTARKTGATEQQGTAALMKGSDTVLFMTNNSTFKYRVKTDDWDKNFTMKWEYPAFTGGAVTDTDTGLVYGIERQEGSTKATWRFTELDAATGSSSFVEVPKRPDSNAWTSMVYSSSGKSIFGYEDSLTANITSLLVYNIATKVWAAVNATGDIPSVRSGACFVEADGGKKLILAGGRSVNDSVTYNDVFIYDVATSVWSKLANAPRPAWGAVCATSGDSLIYWGGTNTKGEVSASNDEGPAILNIASNTWGSRFTPPGQTPQNSSADRAHLALSKVGLVAMTMMAVAASSLVL
ncbi:MAG: hypothetical protein J3Q66DRAFT_359770 [Benniella sp.]|nr:MAG: hypothetical protein J3Q66DRAFT_359770 [Benniella sp.]